MEGGRPVQETLPPNTISEQALALFLTKSEAFDADGQEMSDTLVPKTQPIHYLIDSYRRTLRRATPFCMIFGIIWTQIWTQMIFHLS
jgi:hypothetical protein